MKKKTQKTKTKKVAAKRKAAKKSKPAVKKTAKTPTRVKTPPVEVTKSLAAIDYFGGAAAEDTDTDVLPATTVASTDALDYVDETTAADPGEE